MNAPQKAKTHNFTQQICGCDYSIEPVEDGKKCMTGQGNNIRQGDYLWLKEDNKIIQYQVEAIDYYLEPPDMWIALLNKMES